MRGESLDLHDEMPEVGDEKISEDLVPHTVVHPSNERRERER